MNAPTAPPDSTRWAIIGTGRIAADFAAALARVPDAHLTAVVSRTQLNADRFGDRFGVTHRHTSLEQLWADEHVDVVYIASPASLHASTAIAAVGAGKHVLVEKPFAVNAHEAQSMVDAATDAQIFLMEAMWTRFLPAHRRAAEVIAEGRIGDVLGVSATMGVRMWPDLIPADDRMLDPTRGGGVLLDVGVYPIQLALRYLGHAESAAAIAVQGPTGVDLDVRVALGFPAGRTADYAASMTTRLPNTANVYGTTGRLEFFDPQHCPEGFRIVTPAAEWGAPPTVEQFDVPIGGDGMRYQVTEVHRCLRAGVIESPVMPHADSIEILRVVDLVRTAAVASTVDQPRSTETRSAKG